MATILLPPDFKEFLKLLNSNGVEYLLIGGYAVNYYGYPRATVDMGVWIAIAPDNAARVSAALREFGFVGADPSEFLQPRKIVRMGVVPLRLEILTTIDGVEFHDCYARRLTVEIDGVPVNLIALEDLKRNKAASGRAKDQADLDELP